MVDPGSEIPANTVSRMAWVIERVEIIDSANWKEYPKIDPVLLWFNFESDDRPSGMAFDQRMGNSFDRVWCG